MDSGSTKRSRDVIVVGGGPSGLMAALTARKEGADVLLLEKMEEPGKKLLLTGHGRCNMTNLHADSDLTRSYYKNGRFLSSAFATLPPEKVRWFFDEIGVPSHEEDDGRIFPDAQKALAVRDALVSAISSSGAVIQTGAAVSSIRRSEEDSFWRVVTSEGVFTTKTVILATGGKSFQKTGSEGDGYVLAKMAGHEITALTPALAPIFLASFQAPSEDRARCDACGAEFSMAGLSLSDIGVTLVCKGKKVTGSRGDLLFTHQGVSGPSVMQLSRSLPQEAELYETGAVELLVDFLPDMREEQVEDKLLSEMTKNPNRHMRRILCETFSLAEKVAEMLPGLELAANQVTRELRKKIVCGLKRCAFTVAKMTPLDLAYVTCGGVAIKGINPKTMESKLAPGLFIVGELLDIDGISGGYNLQCAWATGYVAGLQAAAKAAD